MSYEKKNLTYEERKERDKRREQIVHEFIERILYSKFPTYKSNNNRETQLQGMDCSFISKDGTYWIVDEKAATSERYINAGMHYPGEKDSRRHLGTFCLELSMRYKSKGGWKRCLGWLLNPNEINNAYLFVWIDRTKSGYIESVDDITKAQICFVSKAKLWEYINKQGWTKEELNEQLKIILNNPEDYDRKEISGLIFSHPDGLRNGEAPVNILIPRKVYESIAEFNYTYDVNDLTNNVA